MERELIKNIVIEAINTNQNVEISEDILEKNISSLDIDSLSFFQIIVDIENKLDIEFSDKIYEINILNELIDLANEALKEKC